MSRNYKEMEESVSPFRVYGKRFGRDGKPHPCALESELPQTEIQGKEPVPVVGLFSFLGNSSSRPDPLNIDKLVKSRKAPVVVIPAKAGIQ